MNMVPKNIQLQALRALLVTGSAVVLVLLIYILTPLLYPFFIAWAIAYILSPLIRLLMRRARFPRWLAVMVTLLLFLAVVSLLVFLLVQTLMAEFRGLGEHLQRFAVHLKLEIKDLYESDLFSKWLQSLPFELDQTQLDNILSSAASTLSDWGVLLLEGTYGFLRHLLLRLPKLAIIMIIILFAAFIISIDWNKYTGLFRRLPDKLQLSLNHIWSDLKSSFFGYIRGHLLISAITASVFLLGLLILGVNYALVIAFIGGLMDLFPLIGIPLIIVPWAIFSFLTGDYLLGTGLLIMWPIILVVRHALEPKIYASSIGLNPLLLLIFIFAGLQLLGAKGIIIGILVLVILTALSKAQVFHLAGQYIRTGTFFD